MGVIVIEIWDAVPCVQFQHFADEEIFSWKLAFRIRPNGPSQSSNCAEADSVVIRWVDRQTTGVSSKGILRPVLLISDESAGVLEDLKSVRDGMVALRDLFDRKDRLARDNIPQLEKRIMSNENKLSGIKAKGEAAKPGEAEKVETAIVNVSDRHRSKCLTT